ncbi:MAG: DNA polymerase III subunit delta [Clostridia bacterium]|nr:DNA polymerase III subunit delta [Clostridia bacterium]
MKFKEIKRYLVNKPDNSFFYLEGSDAYFREKAQEMIISSLVTAYQDINVTRLNLPSANEIYESCSVLPFMSEYRAVVVREYYPSAQDIKKLVNLKLSDCVLIISNSQKSLIGGLNNNFVDCNKESVPVLANWITTLLKAQNKQTDIHAASMLALYCGQDMMRITNEIKKLSSLPQTQITESDIEQNVSKEIEYQAYMLANAVTESGKDIYQILGDFINKGTESYLINSLYNNYKRMYYVKDSLQNSERLSKALKVKPYAVTMTAKAAKNYDKDSLAGALKLLADTEYKIKSGFMGVKNALYYTVATLLNNNLKKV